MVVSLNTKAIYKTKANLFNGGFGYTNGDILIGDRAFEFYNHQNPESYLQIPWEEIKLVRAHVMFKGKFIRAYYIDTNSSKTFQFVSKDSGRTLKMMREFIGNEKIVKTEPIISFKKTFQKIKKRRMCKNIRLFNFVL